MIDRFGREMFFEHSLKNKQIEILNDRVKLIPARDSDVPNMKKWEMDSIKDGYPNRTIPPEEYDRVEKFIEQDAKDSVWKTRMITFDDEIIGMLTAYQVEDDWYIGEIYIDDRFRGHGIGTLVMKNEINKHDRISLNVYKQNHGAIKLYKSLGFKVYDETEERYMMRLIKSETIQEGFFSNKKLDRELKEALYATYNVWTGETHGSRDIKDFYEGIHMTLYSVESRLIPSLNKAINKRSYGYKTNKETYDKFNESLVKQYDDLKKIFSDITKQFNSCDIRLMEKSIKLIENLRKLILDFVHEMKDLGIIQEGVVNSIHNMTLIPVKDFHFDKVYYGDPIKRTDYMICDDGRPLFTTPYPGLASIFSGRYNLIKILREKGCRRYNLNYDEWGLDLSELKEPLSEVHVRVEGYPDLESFTYTYEGYIHTIDISDIKHNIFRYPWMSKDREVLIANMKHVPIANVEKLKVTYIVSGAESRNFQEGFFNDLKNGVNPYSSKTFFHLSKDSTLNGKTLKPRIPDYISKTKFGKDNPYYEDDTIPRVCFSNSIEGALNAIVNINDGMLEVPQGVRYYVYIPEKPISEYKHKTNKELKKEKLVFDASTTGECWITEPVKLKLYGVIMVQQISDIKDKKTVSGHPHCRVDYKWKWVVKPKVVDKSRGRYDGDEDGKSIKEGYTLSSRNLESYQIMMESTEDNDPDELTIDDAEDDNNVDVNINIDNFGSDNGSTQNEYDPKEVEKLNMLIASEAAAMGEYLEAAKTTNVDVLRRLYSDIGNEERFHAEQLLFAKASLTGEPYEPRDPEVKKEYEELLAMGMDEETALNTAIDKQGMLGADDGDDSDIQDISDEMDVLESALTQYSTNMDMLEMICESNAFNQNDYDRAIDMFMETYCYVEGVDNVADNSQSLAQPKNPVVVILNGFAALLKFVSRLSKNIKQFIHRIRIKNARRNEWIKEHGIAALFQRGVSLYFYSDKEPETISIEPLRYIELLHNITMECGKHVGFNVSTFDQIIHDPKLNSPITRRTWQPIQFQTIPQGCNIVNGVVLTKTKVLVTEQNESTLANLFFGYNDMKTNDGKSVNIYNLLESVCDVAETFAKIDNELLNKLRSMESDPNSIYYKNRKMYMTVVDDMKIVNRGFKVFIKALAHDMNTIISLNNGLLEQTKQADADHIKNPNAKPLV